MRRRIAARGQLHGCRSRHAGKILGVVPQEDPTPRNTKSPEPDDSGACFSARSAELLLQ